MVVKVMSSQKESSPKTVQVVYSSENRKVVRESGIDMDGNPYQIWFDYRDGILHQKTTIANGKVRKTVFLTKHPGYVLYERVVDTTTNGRQVTEEGWTGKHGYFSLTMPNGYKFAHFGQFVIDEWDNRVGRIREIKIDKDGKCRLEKKTLQKKGQAPEILDEGKDRKRARESMSVVSARPDLSAKEKWAKIREIVTRYRQKVI